MDEFYNFISKLNISNKYIIVAVSGGPDSMYLLSKLNEYKNEFNYKIVVAHVHHNLRKESDIEAIKVEEFCKNNSIIFEIYKISKYPNNKFSEEIARKLRYDFFDSIVLKYKTDILFTAHHGDDLMETILMRITRGSNIKGYAGFEAISDDRGYIIARPLIYLTKVEIQDYLDKNKIWYAVDVSNKNEVYTRNRYRKNILPELKKENKNVHKKFMEFSEKILMIDEYVKKVSNKSYGSIVVNNEISIDKFKEEDIIIRKYILEKYLANIYKESITQINNKHIDLILGYIDNKKNVVFDLPLNKKGIVEYNKFKIIDFSIKKSYDIVFDNYVELYNGKKIFVDNSTLDSSNYVIHLDSTTIKFPLHVRTRKKGDYMVVKNMTEAKKVNDIFTNSKVPKEIRDEYPIITDDTGEIIWIPGVKKSHLDRKKEKKYDIILKYS